MSNIGKKPVPVPHDVVLAIRDGRVSVSGPKGELEMSIPYKIKVSIEEKTNGDVSSKWAKVEKMDASDELDKYWGLARSLIANMVMGVTTGFEKKLELSGVGFRAKLEGDTLILNVGFALPVSLKTPSGLAIRVDDNTLITISGIDKESVGNFAAIIKKVRPPDPYKGKGIKYLGEKIRRKAGKAAKAVGGK